MVAKKSKTTVSSYTYEETSDPNIKRFCDRNGDWTHYWLVKEQKFVPASSHILSLGFNKGTRFRTYLESHTKEEIKKVLTEAGDKGTRTHMAIRQLIEGSKITMATKFPSEIHDGRQTILNADEWDNLIAFQGWCEVYKPRVVDHEQTVATDEYAGTYDAFLIISVPEKDKNFPEEVRGEDVLILVDWKSSSGIWNEYKAQLASYYYPIVRNGTYQSLFDFYSGKAFTGIVRIGTKHKCGYEMEVWNESQTIVENFGLFRAALTICNDHESEFKPEIEEIPMQFFIKVPKVQVEKLKKKRAKKEKKVEEQGKLPLDNNEK